MTAAEQYQKEIKDRQLACYSRWVDARVIYRKIKPLELDWVLWLEEQLGGTHYTLTEAIFKEIKEKYESEKR